MSQTISQRRYSRLAASMRTLIDQQEADGWPNPEIERLARTVLHSLTTMAHIKEPADDDPAKETHPIHVLKADLQKYMDALTKAQAAAAGADNVTTTKPTGEVR